MNLQNNNHTPSIEELISLLGMQKHIEGGFASLFYEDPGIITESSLPTIFGSDRPYFSGIYFLVPRGVKTLLHQLPINELWHYCLGAPLEIYEITPYGNLEKTILGPDVKNGHKLVHIVKSGNWFGTHTLGEYTLVTCTTSPGFKPQDFREGKQQDLVSIFPHLRDIIVEFTHSN